MLDGCALDKGDTAAHAEALAAVPLGDIALLRRSTGIHERQSTTKGAAALRCFIHRGERRLEEALSMFLKSSVHPIYFCTCSAQLRRFRNRNRDSLRGSLRLILSRVWTRAHILAADAVPKQVGDAHVLRFLRTGCTVLLQATMQRIQRRGTLKLSRCFLESCCLLVIFYLSLSTFILHATHVVVVRFFIDLSHRYGAQLNSLPETLHY